MAADRPRRLDIDATQVASIVQVIQQLPGKGCSLQSLITELQPDIQQALDRGYSYAEMAEILGKQGIQIAPRTLRQYLKRGKTMAKPRSSTRKPAAKQPPSIVTTVASTEPQTLHPNVPASARTIGNFVEMPDEL